MIRTVTIKPVLNGFVCEIGCQQVVFTNLNEMAEQIVKYFKNPNEVEKSYIANAINKMNEIPACPPQSNPACCGQVVQERR